MEKLIGRKKKIAILQDCYATDKSEFVAVYGRRRVGKTFLITETFQNKFFFQVEGILNEKIQTQLKNFHTEIIKAGGSHLPKAESWLQAFKNLNTLVQQSKNTQKKVIFLDEIPSMATKNSGFLEALGHFYNRYASRRKDILLIICGFASSWIVEYIVDNQGGLHNRLTRQLLLQPFTLLECETYLKSRQIDWDRYQISEAYMILGGIPYYLSLLFNKLSFHQNIDALYFSPDGPLFYEYDHLFASLFKKPQGHLAVVQALAKVSQGMTRNDLESANSALNNGYLTKVLTDLIQCGFLRAYQAYKKKTRDTLYQLIDPFTLFHLRFESIRKTQAKDYWLHFSFTPAHNTWAGLAFERVCLNHLEQIRKALGISGVLTQVYSWRSKSSIPGAQIDLVLKRADNIIHLCEVKYSIKPFKIDKQYAALLREKRFVFLSETGAKAAHTTLISTYGLTGNTYAGEILFQLTLDDLFQ
ncbi:MAG: AAA family ATPase [Erysipelotrichaceae bacterium]|jgi:predicted AAA+ superfamily ATPase|nr:AAA family ATPase [Erysipelotrichaceae bacterium]